MEDKKLKAAIDVVSDSLLHGWTPNAYAEYVKAILPDDYEVKWDGKGVRCISKVGLDNESFGYLLKAIKQRVGDKFQEVYHNTCTSHKDFIIYIKK